MTPKKDKVLVPDMFGEIMYVEELLCLATLVANKVVPDKPTIEYATLWYMKFGDCDRCPFADNAWLWQ